MGGRLPIAPTVLPQANVALKVRLKVYGTDDKLAHELAQAVRYRRVLITGNFMIDVFRLSFVLTSRGDPLYSP